MELPVQQVGDRHPNTIELASWLVHVLCDFKAKMTSRSFSFSLIHHENTSWWNIYIYICIYIYIYIYTYDVCMYIFCYTFYQDQLRLVLNLREKCIILSSKKRSVDIPHLLWSLGRISSIFHKLNFHFQFCLYCNWKNQEFLQKI